jgi:hypothetical protein
MLVRRNTETLPWLSYLMEFYHDLLDHVHAQLAHNPISTFARLSCSKLLASIDRFVKLFDVCFSFPRLLEARLILQDPSHTNFVENNLHVVQDRDV